MEENNNLSSENIQPDERAIGIFKYLDYDLGVDERRAKFTKYDSVLCETCNKEIDKPDYRCKDCYDKETDYNEKRRMNYGICKMCFKSNFFFNKCCILFKTSDYNYLDEYEIKVKYSNYCYILCEKCNQEIDKQDYYCKNCYGQIVFKTSDYELDTDERKAKYGNYRYIL